MARLCIHVPDVDMGSDSRSDSGFAGFEAVRAVAVEDAEEDPIVGDIGGASSEVQTSVVEGKREVGDVMMAADTLHDVQQNLLQQE